MSYLILIMPEGQRRVALAKTNSLGRHPNNTIQVLDRIVSKEHCIVEERGDGFWLKDLGSLNGTWINESRVNGEKRLKHGDKISMGNTTAFYDDGRGLPGHLITGAGATVRAETQGTSPSSSTATGPVLSSPQPVPRARRSTAPLDQRQAPHFSPQVLADQRRMAANMSGHKTMAIPQFGTEGSSFGLVGQVDVKDEGGAIGTQISAQTEGFLEFDQVKGNEARLRRDYERLRLSLELSRELALERNTTKLLGKILQQIFKFVKADRGIILLGDNPDKLEPGAFLRRDGQSSEPIEVSSTILAHVIKERASVLSHNTQNDFAESKGKSMILNKISSAVVVPLLHNDKLLGVLWLDAHNIGQFQKQDLEIITSLASQAAMFIENNNLTSRIEKEILTRQQFSRLLSPSVAERVVSGELQIKQGGELVEECTVFNSDIRGFTRMSAAAAPEVIVEMLNGYFELMVEVLFKYDGTLDKFMGDGLMALWGAPIRHQDDAIRAVMCSLDQMTVLAEFNRERVRKNQAPLGIGIGIHTGRLVAGYIGSSKSLSYTVIGDTVNTSARLCGHAKVGQILVSRQTYEKLEGKFEVQELEPARLKGKEHPVQVYNVIRRVR